MHGVGRSVAIEGSYEDSGDAGAEALHQTSVLGPLVQAYLNRTGSLESGVHDAVWELGRDAIPQAACGDVQQMAAQITQDPARISPQPIQSLAHALELLGVGVATDLQR